MVDQHNLEEQLLSQEAERRVSEQLDSVEKIDIDVQTDLLKILQGKADGVSFAGQGVVVQKDIRVQELKVQTDKLSFNPLSAIFGQIELNQPVSSVVRIVLTQADINRALTSDYVRKQMQNFKLNVDGEVVILEPQKIEIYLPGTNKMAFQGTVLLHEKGNSRLVGFTATTRPRTATQPIRMESFNCTQGEGFSLDLVLALMEKVKKLVNLPYFELEDMVFRIKEMEVQEGSIAVLLEAYFKRLPSS